MLIDTKIQYIAGVGPKMAEKLNRLGIETMRDLIFYYPRAYKDFTQISKIADLGHQRNCEVTIRGNIIGIANKKTSRRQFTITEAVVEDGTGSIKVIWFNQPFLAKMLKPGREVILNGKIEYNFYSKEVVMQSPERALYPKIEAVYPETAGITSKYIGKLVMSVMKHVSSIEEWIPEEFLISNSKFLNKSQLPNDQNLKQINELTNHPVNDLLPIHDALLNIHQPKNSEILEQARRRIAFDELFMIALRANLSKEEIKKENAPEIKIDDDKIAEFVKGLPFDLTNDQKKSAWQIIKDIAQNKPMNRLLNGDVGSGKTVVAAIAAFAAVKAGFRAVFMVPTEILAQQHFRTFCQLFIGQNMSVGLYTANCKDNFQFKILNLKSISNSKSKKLRTDNCELTTDIVIGTQALIQKDVKLENIGLVIVDEQHRFGVKQRSALLELRTDNCEPASPAGGLMTTQKVKPHFLSMTATPIPRTLHLALFGDLDISVISQKPADRKEIKTRVVEETNRYKAYEFIRKQIQVGRQAFIICPLIEQNADNRIQITELFAEEKKTVTSEYEKLQKIFPEFNIGMLHGKLKSKEKDEIMEDFSSNKINILVSTSVVEVGVDVPNATVMVIEDAERFGLAQIHQFRGRVGRADHQSFCFLFSSTMSPKARKRLESLEMTSDGFRLAEIDLETRGPGAVFGTEQSGLLDLKMANFSDRNLIEQASLAAKSIVENDPELRTHPLLKEKIADYLQNKHLE